MDIGIAAMIKQGAMKCIVQGCVNRVGEGGFVGSLCTPCHIMITTGEISGGNTFIHEMKRKLDTKTQQLNDAKRVAVSQDIIATQVMSLRATLNNITAALIIGETIREEKK
jgi:hypothetical protein